MANKMKEIFDNLLDATPEGPGRRKLERVAEASDEEQAEFLFHRGKLPQELHRKYGLDKVGSNVSAGEIPEEAPDYVGDVDTATSAGLDLIPEAGTPVVDEDLADEEQGEVVEDYNDLTVAKLKAEVDARNAERDEDDQIVVDGTTKADYVDALEADDEEQAAG